MSDTKQLQDKKDEVLKTPEVKEGDQEIEQPKKSEGGKLRDNLEKTLAELAKYKEAEKQREEDEARKKGDFEELLRQKEEEIKELKSQATQEKIQNSLSKALRKKSLNPEFEELVTNYAKDQIELDEQGNSTNLDLVVEELAGKYPSAFKNSKVPTGKVPTTGGSSATGRLSMADYRKLSYAEREKAKENGTAPVAMI
jgi:hypothetical protein